MRVPGIKASSIRAGGMYRTKAGLLARIYATDANGLYTVHGAILIDGIWSVESWTKSGKRTNKDSPFDLAREVK